METDRFPVKIMEQRNLLIVVALVVIIAVAGAYVLWQRPKVPEEVPEKPEEIPETPEVPMKRVLRSTWAFPTYIDPHVYTDRSSGAAQYNLYDPLIKIGTGGTIVPWLATDWTWSPDGLTLTFTIKQGVKFHDGTELTAEDVAFSLNRQLIMGTGRGYILVPHVYPNATALDDYTVQLYLKHSFGPLLSALNGWYVVNKDLVMQHLKEGEYGEWGDFGAEWLVTHDAGSGAYMVKSFILEEKLVLEKFEDYWAGFADKAPDIVEMLATTEPITVKTMLSNGELEYSDPWQSLESFLGIKEIPNVKIAALMGTTGNWNLMMNTKKPPTDDVHFRRALAYLLNYTKVTTELFPGTIQAQGPIPHAMAGFDPEVFQYYLDFDKAREELALSKYADNYTDYEIELHWVAEVPDEEKVCMMFMADAAKVGINLKVVKVPWTTYVHNAGMLETSPNIVYVGAGGAFPEAGAYFVNRYHSSTATSWQQNEWLLNETLDAMIEDALQTLDFDERMEKYKVLQREIVNQCPTIWLYIGISWHAYPDYVTPEWVVSGEYMKSAILGDVYLVYGSEAEFRLYEVDRLIEYAG